MKDHIYRPRRLPKDKLAEALRQSISQIAKG